MSYLSFPLSPSFAVLVAKLCLTLCNPIDCSTPGFPVLHYLPEFAQTQVHWVGCYSVISSSATPFSFCLHSFQHQGLFQWVGSSHQVAKVLELQLQHQSLNEYSGLISFRICCPRDSQESSSAPQFESISSLVLSLLYGGSCIHTWLLGKP